MSSKLDLAARAAWLSFVKGKTQDEIAAELSVTRTVAQRMVALAVKEGLITFRLNRRLAKSVDVAERLKDALAIESCEIAPAANDLESNRAAVGELAADYISRFLSAQQPQTIAIGRFGGTVLEAVGDIDVPPRSDHVITSIVGNLTRDGRSNRYDVAQRLADKAAIPYYPLPFPVIVDSSDECSFLKTQRNYLKVRDLVSQANVVMSGIGPVNHGAPLVTDGYITHDELDLLLQRGAVGELAGWSFDVQGEPVHTLLDDRVTSMVLARPPTARTVLVTSGNATPVIGAMRGRWANALITDERTGEEILSRLNG